MKRIDSRIFIDEADSKLTQLFRKQRKMLLYNRSGVVLFVDDMPEQMSFLEAVCKEDVEFVSVQNLKSAKDYVVSRNQDAIKIIVIDIGLEKDGKNRDGLKFIEWLRNYYPEIPFIVCTGRLECVEEVKQMVPGADVFLKGSTNLMEYLDALGITPIQVSVEKEENILPTDSHVLKSLYP